MQCILLCGRRLQVGKKRPKAAQFAFGLKNNNLRSCEIQCRRSGGRLGAAPAGTRRNRGPAGCSEPAGLTL